MCFTRAIQHPEMILPISKQRLCFHKIFAIVSSNVSIAAAMEVCSGKSGKAIGTLAKIPRESPARPPPGDRVRSSS